jgi:hypothetical protein
VTNCQFYQFYSFGPDRPRLAGAAAVSRHAAEEWRWSLPDHSGFEAAEIAFLASAKQTIV